MSYNIVFRPKAKDQLSKLEDKVSKRIVSKLKDIRSFPEHFLRYIKQFNAHRLRVGDYRIFVDLDNSTEIIRVLSIRHRDDAYEGAVG